MSYFLHFWTIVQNVSGGSGGEIQSYLMLAPTIGELGIAGNFARHDMKHQVA